jgi:hypothetical protein
MNVEVLKSTSYFYIPDFRSRLQRDSIFDIQKSGYHSIKFRT